jgi:hypothetical protein
MGQELILDLFDSEMLAQNRSESIRHSLQEKVGRERCSEQLPYRINSQVSRVSSFLRF